MSAESKSLDSTLGASGPTRVLAVINAQSGTCDLESVKAALARHFGTIPVRIHELASGDDLESILAEAIAGGIEQVVAGGGDGTISAVASHLVHSPARLAILPLGTANVLSLELRIPTNLEAACQLAASRIVEEEREAKTSRLLKIDAMKLAGKHYLTQVGVGIDALMIQNTSTELKRRIGKLAYLISATKHMVAFKPHRFMISMDGQSRRYRASQVVVANTGMMGQPSFRWGPDISPEDGRLNVCLINSAGIGDYLRLLWVVFRGHREKSPKMKHKSFEKSIRIETRRPMPVQADGEIVGDTPVTIELVPHAVEVIVPVEDKYGS